MRPGTATVAAACALAAVLLAIVLGCVGPAPERPIHERLDLPSLTACGVCHQDIWEEWAKSLHHRAWTNDSARAATDDFRKAECRPCHSPFPVLESGLDRPPRFRDFNRDDGVHCLSCHGIAGGVAATRTIPDAPCRPRRDGRLSEARLCWPCHEPTHQAFREYETSTAFADGVRCQDCHMQTSAGKPGSSHGPHGGFDAEFVARALRWRARIEGAAVVVELENRCGHKFPGEIPSRSFVVRVEIPGHETARELLRKPHKGEARADNRLLPDERRVLRFPLPAGAAGVKVRLAFVPLPLLPEAASFVLGEWEWRR